MKLRKGDTIVVTAGRDAAKQGKVDRVYVKAGTVMVDGINMYKRHVKKNEQLPEGGILDLPRPIDVSKVSLLCPKCKKPTRIGYKLENGKKTRICRKCSAAL
jgi:large subunit ribosomal protein L24